MLPDPTHDRRTPHPSSRARRKASGRPLDPAVGEALLVATRALLDEHGYAGLRVADIARCAGVGRGALYRRWPNKRALALDALRGTTPRLDVPVTGDPVADVAAGLEALAEVLAKQSLSMVGIVVAGHDPELADVIRESKFAPLYRANRAQVRRAIGKVPDLNERADLGPVLILCYLIVHGPPPSAQQIRTTIVPLLLGTNNKHTPDQWGATEPRSAFLGPASSGHAFGGLD